MNTLGPGEGRRLGKHHDSIWKKEYVNLLNEHSQSWRGWPVGEFAGTRESRGRSGQNPS